LTSPTDGQILKYNGTSGKWENASGGGGSAGENDLLYRGDGSTNAQLISLSSPYTNYDVLIIRNLRFADGLTYKYDMTLECRNLSTNDYIQGIGWYGSNNYWTYQITDADELTYYSDGNDWVLYEIYGVKTGSSGGGGGGNYTETTLYTGSTLVDNMQLSDDISNYNAICVVAGQVDGSNNLRFPHVIPTSQMMDALTNGYEIGLCSDASYIYFTVDSTTEISKGSYQNNFFIAKVIGINY